jgi:DNA-binding response OmpR family regulator
MLRRDALAIVEEIGGGQTALEVALQGNYNIILFDSSSSDRGGLDFIRRLRKSGNNTPLLVHSGPRYLAVKALDLGADEYLVRPIHLPELLARIRAVVRRSRNLSNSCLQVDALEIDPNNQRVTNGGKELARFSKREFSLLELLVLRRGELVINRVLLEHLGYPNDKIGLSNLKVVVSRLRNKLGGALVILTIRGLGYKVRAGEALAA